MAKLTDVISTEMRGKETMQPVKKGPSIFEAINGIAGVVSDTAKQYSADKDNLARQARQAKADRLADSDRGIQNFGADALLNLGGAEAAQQAADAQRHASTPLNQMDAALFGGGTINDGPDATRPYETAPITQGEIQQTSAAMTEGDNIGQQAARLQAGVKQGRISRAAYELQIEGIMRKGFAMFPDSKYILLEQMDKYAINHPMMTEYRQAKAEEEKQIGKAQDREEGLIDHAVTKMGYDPNEFPREKLIEIGRIGIKAEFDTRLAREAAEDEFKRSDRDRAAQERVEGVRDQAVSDAIYTSLGPQIGAGIDLFTTVMGDKGIPETERTQRGLEFINSFKPRAYGLIDQSVQRAVAEGNLTSKAGDALRTRLRAQVDDVTLQFDASNPAAIHLQNGKIFQTFKDRMGLDALQTMPIFTAFKAAFGSTEAVAAMTEQLATDPKFAAAFGREMKGFTGLQQGDATIRVKNVLAMMSDNNTALRDLTPEEGKEVLKTSRQLLDKHFYAKAISGDPAAQRTVYNTVGKVANAAIDLTAGSTSRELVAATHYIANRGFRDSLLRAAPEHKEFAGVVADEARAATQKLLINLRTKASADPYYKIVFNLPERQFKIVSTGKTPPTARIVSSNSGREGTYQTTTVGGPGIGPSQETREMLGALTSAYTFLQTTSQFEDDASLKNADYNERARFYVAGVPPKSTVAEPGKSTASGRELITRLNGFWDNVKVDWDKVPKLNIAQRVEDRTGIRQGRIEVKEDGSRVGQNLKGRNIVIPSADEIAEKFGKNPIYQAIVSTAQELGIPQDVAVRLGHVESGGSFNANMRPNSAGAMGPIQVVPKHHNKLAQELYGKNVPELTPEQIIKVGLTFLKRNFEKHGNWQDAAHDYIGRGHDDGNVESRVYAELIGA